MLALFRTYALTAILAAGIFYFGFHMLTGERGLMSAQARERTLAARNEELAEVTKQRLELQARAHLLSDNSLSADLLEERARSLLGFVGPRDYVIRVQTHSG